MTDDELYSGIAKETTDSTKLALTKSAFIAHNVNPDQHAKNVKDAVKQGIPRQLAVPAEGPVNADKLNSLVADYHKIAETSPVTATHLSNPEVAKVADHEHMDYTEHLLKLFAGKDHPDMLSAHQKRLLPSSVDTRTFGNDPSAAGARKQLEPYGGLLQFVNPEFYVSGAADVLGALMGDQKSMDAVTKNVFSAMENLPLAQAGAPKASALNFEKIKVATETTKKSKLREHDTKAYQDFTTDAARHNEPVKVLTTELDNIVRHAGTTPEAVLTDPAAYHEARLDGADKVELPLADVLKLADQMTDDDIKKMSIGDTPSVAEVEEQNNASGESVEEKPVLQPAVKVGDEVKVGTEGQRHTDILKDAPEEDRGFVTPEGEFIGREKAAAWMKNKRPDLYEKLPEDQKEALHSEGLWKSQGIEPGPKAETTGITNRHVEEEGGNVSKESISDKARREEGQRLVDSGEYDPRTGARDIVANRKGFVSAEKQNALRYDKVRIKNEQKTVMGQLEKAIEADDQDAIRQLTQRREQLQEDFNTNQQATTYAGTEASASLRARIGEMKDDYSYANTMQRVRLAIGKVDPATGKIEVPEEVRAKVEKLTKDLDAALTKVQEAEEKASRTAAQRMIVDAQKQAAKATGRTAKKAARAENRKALDVEFKALSEKFKKALKDERGAVGLDINAPIDMILRSVPKSIIGSMRNIMREKGPSIVTMAESITDQELASVPQRVWNKLNADGLQINIDREIARQEQFAKEKNERYPDPTSPVHIGPDRLADRIRRRVDTVKRVELANYIFNAIEKDYPGWGKRALDRLSSTTGAVGPDIELNKGPLNANTIKLMLDMAKNRIKAGLNTVDGVVNAVFNEVKDLVEGITKRDVRDAISGYGKKGKATKDQLTLQLSEFKKNAKLLSEAEDTLSKKPGEELEQAIKESGVDTALSKDAKDKWKASLTKVTKQLTSHISKLEKQLKKSADPELQAHKDALTEVLNKLEGKHELTSEQRTKIAVTAVRKSILELERRIKEKDLSPAEKGKPVKETPELKGLREERDKLKEQYEEMKKAARPPKDPAAARLQAYKTHLATRIAELERKLVTGDFAKKPRSPIKLDAEAERAKETAERLKSAVEGAIEEQRLLNRSLAEKTRDTIITYRRAIMLTRASTLLKITNASLSRFGITPMEGIMGSILELAPPFKEIGQAAHREGGGINTAAEIAGVRQLWEKDTWADIPKIWKTGQSKLGAIYGEKQSASPTILNSVFRLHQILHNPAHRAEFFRSFKYIIDSYARADKDVTDPLVQAQAAAESFIEATKATLMNANMVTTWTKATLRFIENKGGIWGKAGAFLASLEFPILNLPTNFADEVLSYTAGGLRAIPGLSKAALKGIDKLSPKEADFVMRNLKKNSLAALMATAVFSGVLPITFGGYYRKGEKRVPGELGPGEWAINGKKMPSVLADVPLLMALQVFQTVKNVAEALRLQGENSVTQYSQGIMQSAWGLSQHLPIIGTTAKDMNDFATPEGRQKWFSEFAAGLIVPGIVDEVAKYKNDTPRLPTTLTEGFENKIPGLRGNVPVNEKKIEREIAGKLRKDESLTPYQQEAWDRMTPAKQEAITKESEETPLQVAFKGMSDPHLIKSIRAWKNLSDEERSQVQELYDERVSKYIENHNLTDEQLADLAKRLTNAEERK